VKCFRQAAEQGNAGAELGLGRMYANGEGVAKDSVEAMKWFRKAGEQGSAVAQFGLGRTYDIGDGVAKDPVEAVKWFRKAAEQGYAGAQCSLGVCYANGEGVAKDPVEAAKWFRKAAEQDTRALQSTSVWCMPLVLVWQRSGGSRKMVPKSGDQGDADAQCSLGGCYATGVGVGKDPVEGAKWYRQALSRATSKLR